VAPAADDPLYVEDEIPICDRVCLRERIETVVGRTDGYRSFVLAYDASGCRVHQELLDSSGRVLRRWLYEQGKPLQELAYGRDGRLDWRWEIVYRPDGLWQEKRMHAASGEPMHSVVADRDANGRLLTATYVKAGGGADAIRVDTYRYDDRGRLVEVDMGALGDCVFEYGAAHGLLTRRSRDMPGASAFGDVLELEYDTRELPVRLTRANRSLTVLEYESSPAGS
jgi:hypothetical protein